MSHAVGDLQQLSWRKARRSIANGDCVEVAITQGQVFVRDSKQPSVTVLGCSGEVWKQFLQGVQLGSFGLPGY